MTTEEALGEFLVEQRVMSQGEGRSDWYAGSWFYTPILGVTLPFFPRVGFRRGLPAHDTHHMLNGHATDGMGECETAAWEPASETSIASLRSSCSRWISSRCAATSPAAPA